MEDTIEVWATKEFSHARLGNISRTSRLVAMASQVALHSTGRITGTFSKAGGHQEAAFRFIENDTFSYQAMGDSMRRATALRAAQHKEVVVAVDGVAFTVAHRSGGFGPVSEKGGPRGAHAMSALLMTSAGVPLGISGQVFWTRSDAYSPAFRHDKRPLAERESAHWLTAIGQTCAVLQAHAPATMPWFQLDRGGDCAAVLLDIQRRGVHVTARACYDRCITGGKLWSNVAAARCLGTYRLAVPARDGKRARTATIMVRARHVELTLRPNPNDLGAMKCCKMWVVEARERSGGTDGILWRLLTTKPAATFEQACNVIAMYTRRWRIEELHKAWKSGACNVEDSWIRQREHFYKWATILCAVAVRIERIKLLSRTEPFRDARDEFTRDEIDAVILLCKPKGVARGATPTLGQLTQWIADIGGYTGKSSGGPPGTKILSRAMERVNVAAEIIASLRNGQDKHGQ